MFEMKNLRAKTFLVFLIIFTLLPNLIRDMKILLVFFFLALVLAFELIRKGFPKNNSLVYLFLFSGLCLIYAIFSWFFGNWTHLYEFDHRYVFRQAYFAVMAPIFLLATIQISKYLGSDFYNFIAKNSMKLLLAIFILDIITAYFFGDPRFYFYNDYTYHMDKGFIWLFVAFLSFYSVFCTNNATGVILVVVLGFIVQNIVGYGTMFTAATGQVVFVLILLNYFVLQLTKKIKLCYLMNLCALFAVILFVLISPFFSDLFISDLNTYWRLESWYKNISAVASNLGFGSGFGVSYFPITHDVVDEAYKAYSPEATGGGLLDQLFVRGQHSSIINVLFRTGVLGLLLFLCFIGSSIFNFRKHMDSRITFAVPVAICGVFNVATHVGLESPPFMISFSIAFGYLIYMVWSRNKHFSIICN